uniref:limulus clotting factor C n=1 Tax=Scolopendra japonica TaxID=2609777 RepID=A0A0E4B814_9MYRI|nr:limulus clotting factor C-like [Scolopendra japonica]
MAVTVSSLIVLAAVLIHLASCAGVDLGLCHKHTEDCPCGGNNGYQISIPAKECTFFYRWRPYCKPCDEVEKDVRCAPYRTCQDCDPNLDGCVRCPLSKFGKWCTLDCPCKNGGSCDRDTGKCSCPPQYQGPTCEQLAECAPPPLSPGVHYKPQALTYKIGSKVTYSCSTAGEFLEGPPTRECMPTVKWSGEPPKCIRECPLVATPVEGSVNLPTGRLTEGVTVSYSCNENYRLIGERNRTCQKDGSWSGDDPICEKLIICKAPDNIEFGSVSTHRRGSTSDNTPGTTVTFTCNSGYTLIGEEYIQCQDDGNWSKASPICAKEGTVCPNVGQLINGEIKFKGQGGPQAFLEGSEVEYTCKSLHYMYGQNKATCFSNGTWSSAKPVCIKLTTCPSLEPLANGKIQIQVIDQPVGNTGVIRIGTIPGEGMASRTGSGPRFRTGLDGLSMEARTAMFNTKLPEGHYHVGTRAIFSCESRYYDLVGSRLRTCQTTGQWSGRQPTCIPVCGRSSGPRVPFITHGNVSELGQWPWQVGLAARPPDSPIEEWDIFCGGSLIAERWVVTAAHCVTYEGTTQLIPADELQLYFGKYYRDNNKDDDEVEVREVEEIHIHHDYEPSSFESDIALVRLKTPVKLTSRVQPVCLPTDIDESNSRVKEGNPGVITGWGRTETGNLSAILQQAKVPIVSNKQCEEDYKKVNLRIIVSRNMLCAGYDKGARDSCSGDSGGPFVFPIDDREDKWVLEGIVSWGSILGCGNPRQYGGYVRVQKFYQWILEFI